MERRAGVIALCAFCVTFMTEVNATFLSSAFVDIDSSEIRGGDFNRTGEEIQQSGTFYYDTNPTIETFPDGSSSIEGFSNGLTRIDHASRASAVSGALRTESSLSFSSVDPGSLESDEQFFDIFDNFIDVPTRGTVSATASQRETLTVTGGDNGSSGTITFGFQVDGSITNPVVEGEFSDGSRGSTTGPFSSSTILRLVENQTRVLDNGTTVTSAVADNQSSFSTGSVSGTKAFDELAELSLDLIFGQEFTMSFFLNSFSSFDFDSTESSGFIRDSLADFSTNSSFFNTASLGGIQVFDADGKAIDFAILSESNDPFLESFSSLAEPPISVPEPGSLALFALGLVGLSYRRRRSVLARS